MSTADHGQPPSSISNRTPDPLVLLVNSSEFTGEDPHPIPVSGFVERGPEIWCFDLHTGTPFQINTDTQQITDLETRRRIGNLDGFLEWSASRVRDAVAGVNTPRIREILYGHQQDIELITTAYTTNKTEIRRGHDHDIILSVTIDRTQIDAQHITTVEDFLTKDYANQILSLPEIDSGNRLQEELLASVAAAFNTNRDTVTDLFSGSGDFRATTLREPPGVVEFTAVIPRWDANKNLP